MPAAHRSELLRGVLKAMAEDEAVLDELVLAARTHSPEVARLPEAENRRHVQVLLAAGLDSLAAPGHPDEQDFATAEALGADRAAQGVPITGLLRGVQAGRSRAVRIAIDRSRAAGVPDDVILEAVLDLDRYTGALERHIVNGYHTAELQLSRTTRDARTQLLRGLLLPGAGDPPSPEDLHQAGLRPGGRYHCLVSDVTDPAHARALEQRLLGLGGVYGLVEGRLSGVAARLPTDDLGVLLIAAPGAPLSDLRDVHTLCTAALSVAARRGLRGVHHLTDLAGETALAAQPLLGELLAGSLLGRLDPADDFHRELACTALAYLDHGQRLGHTAAALHLHPNTVRYRLDRLAEITALSLGEHGAEHGDGRSTVPATVHAWWALHTWLGRANPAT